jgi:hypothetical protein
MAEVQEVCIQEVQEAQEEQEAEAVFREIHIHSIALDATADSRDSRAKAKPNAIRTTKFTALNWLPKSILVQFR